MEMGTETENILQVIRIFDVPEDIFETFLNIDKIY